MSELVAAVDCGTNTTRLLISDGRDDLVRIERITGLGRGLGSSGLLGEDALRRVEVVLREYSEVIARNGVERCRAVATSAVRDARNASTFFDMAERALGYLPAVISGSEEGALTFAGATRGLHPSAGPFLVVDIGGGSTEFAVGSGEVQDVMSTEMGSVRFTEQFLGSDPPAADELSNLLQVVGAHIEDVQRGLVGLASANTIVAVAGTATTVAAVEIGLQVYDSDVINDFVLHRAAAEDVFRTLATESLEDRGHNPGLHPSRADVIVAGSAILVGIMRHLDADEVIVREYDILDGLIGTMV